MVLNLTDIHVVLRDDILRGQFLDAPRRQRLDKGKARNADPGVLYGHVMQRHVAGVLDRKSVDNLGANLTVFVKIRAFHQAQALFLRQKGAHLIAVVTDRIPRKRCLSACRVDNHSRIKICLRDGVCKALAIHFDRLTRFHALNGV